MIANHVGAPMASSCGRLFEAVAAAIGICFEHQAYEGEAAARLEAAVDPRALDEMDELAYPFAIPRTPGSCLPYLEPLAMWHALLGDLILGSPIGVIAARFHRGLGRAVAQMATKLARTGGGEPVFDTVALSGGCFQNRILFEQCASRLRAQGFTVLAHAQVPCNDGGLALGQAAVCAARLLDPTSYRRPAPLGSASHVLAAFDDPADDSSTA
jgi:hydrogenase maturation protein HypF